ncbi:hypothetical protein Hanom_Chr04g00326891 [Helianthus anomalus]
MKGWSKTYIPKNFYRTGGSKTYIPKNFYTKTTYITLLSEKFGGLGAPPGPFYTSPLILVSLKFKSSKLQKWTRSKQKAYIFCVTRHPYKLRVTD